MSGHRPRVDAEKIDALLARYEGTTVAEAINACPQVGLRAMLKRLQHLVTYGKAWSTKVPGRLAHRFFGSQALRDAWQADNPARPTKRAAQALARQTSLPRRNANKMLTMIIERGANGTLPADLTALIGKPSGAWITDMEQRGKINCVKHRGVRIIAPAGVTVTPRALLACQRRIDHEFVTRNRRGKYTVVPGKPGQPAGVNIPAKACWRGTPASNDGQVKPIICPAPKFDNRYQMDPLTRVAGGFATQRIGEHDMPASNWAAQVLAQGRAA